MARIKTNLSKELYNHWSPKEMKAIAACCYGTWLKLPMIQKETITQLKRPWLIYELFMKSVEQFAQAFENDPAGDVDFLIAHFDPATRVIDSGTVELDPSRVAEVKQIYQALFGNDLKGNNWGDEEKLKSYVEGVGGEICRKYFVGEKFAGAPWPRPRLISDVNSVGNIEDLELRGRGSLEDFGEEVAEKKKPGRPKKEMAEA